ncbi:MAG: hypothetical protein CFE25_13205 [Chitinophagaceae bacterium BSSC1]|nr:MAG: hypothetical protein CFE25_13205 [Chitinophagaceae bacterium BSSC1]
MVSKKLELVHLGQNIPYMKKIFVMALSILLAGSAFSQSATTSPQPKEIGSVVEFKNDAYNFGKIAYGKPVEYVVEFKNIGKDTLTVLQAQPGCGCTTPSFTPNEKFGPGQTSKMTIRFNSSVVGAFTRFIDVYFSGGLTKKLSFTGEGIQEAAPAPATNNGTAKSKPALITNGN